jgi:hypothetical protein
MDHTKRLGSEQKSIDNEQERLNKKHKKHERLESEQKWFGSEQERLESEQKWPVVGKSRPST